MADEKLSQLDPISLPFLSTDLFYVVRPGEPPGNKVTWAEILASIVGSPFTTNLATDDVTKAISFPSTLPSIPRGLALTLVIPTGGDNFTVGWDSASLTADGFTAMFGAAVPGSGYKLNIIPIL